MDEKRTTNKERLQEITAGIEQGIKELFESEKYRKYLSVMSRFHRYSVNNTILIYMQRPDATLVAGFTKWKNQFDHHVKKGERGITIIAPTPYKKKVEEAKRDPDTQAPVLDSDGKEVMEEREIVIPMFRPVKVFDVSQTDGKPLPELASPLSGTVPHYEAFLEALRRSVPVPMEFEPMAPDMDGYFSPGQQRIALREGMSQVQTISSAVHEIAHSKLHDPKLLEAKSTWKIVMVSDEGTKKDLQLGFDTEAEAELAAAVENWQYVDENQFVWQHEVEEDPNSTKQIARNRRTEEVEAESISYAVCQYFGIQTGENSFGYIASWSKDKELEELKASLETINKTSCELIDQIEEHYKEICKEQGILLTESPVPVQTCIQPQPDDLAFLSQKGNCYAIYQVNGTAPPNVRFMNLDWLKSRNLLVDRSNYDLVYTGPIGNPDDTEGLLEKLYEQFNLQIPEDFCGTSMSVSDIVALKRDGRVSYHYCDSIGFAEIPGFLPDIPVKSVNLPQRTPKGDGIPKKPSVMEQLKGFPKLEHKKTPHKDRTEMEI